MPKAVGQWQTGGQISEFKDAKTLLLGIEPFAIFDLHLLLTTTSTPTHTLQTAAHEQLLAGFFVWTWEFNCAHSWRHCAWSPPDSQLLASPLDTLAVIRSSQLRVIRSSTTPHRRTSRLVPVKSGESTPPLAHRFRGRHLRPHSVAYGREKRR